MSSDTDESPVKVVLDTNILISAIAFGGKPKDVLDLVLEERIIAITSPILLAEFKEIYRKKFPLLEEDFELTIKNIEEIFGIIQPTKTLDLLRDNDDNRVLEAALEGNCNYIVTGDKDLLELKSYKAIQVVTAEQFLKIMAEN